MINRSRGDHERAGRADSVNGPGAHAVLLPPSPMAPAHGESVRLGGGWHRTYSGGVASGDVSFASGGVSCSSLSSLFPAPRVGASLFSPPAERSFREGKAGFRCALGVARLPSPGFDGSVSTARFRRLGCRCSIAAALHVLQASSPPVRVEHRKEKGHRPAEQVSGRGGPESKEFGIGGGRDRVSVRIRQRIGPRPRPARRPLWPER